MADTENGKLEYPCFLFVFSLFSNIVIIKCIDILTINCNDMLKSTVLLCGTKHTVRNTTVELFLNDVRNFQI